jgi:hypothetical protein
MLLDELHTTGQRKRHGDIDFVRVREIGQKVGQEGIVGTSMHAP